MFFVFVFFWQLIVYITSTSTFNSYTSIAGGMTVRLISKMRLIACQIDFILLIGKMALRSSERVCQPNRRYYSAASAASATSDRDRDTVTAVAAILTPSRSPSHGRSSHSHTARATAFADGITARPLGVTVNASGGSRSDATSSESTISPALLPAQQPGHQCHGQWDHYKRKIRRQCHQINALYHQRTSYARPSVVPGNTKPVKQEAALVEVEYRVGILESSIYDTFSQLRAENRDHVQWVQLAEVTEDDCVETDDVRCSVCSLDASKEDGDLYFCDLEVSDRQTTLRLA